jgi:hypothetical protein
MSIGETECSTVDTTARNAAQYSNRTARDIRVQASSNQANILYQRFAIDRRRELTGFTSYSAVEGVGFPMARVGGRGIPSANHSRTPASLNVAPPTIITCPRAKSPLRSSLGMIFMMLV